MCSHSRRAAGALHNLAAGGEAFQQRIAAVPGAAEGLVQLLGSTPEHVQEAAAEAVRNLAAGREA
jgi:hypothetical protein